MQRAYIPRKKYKEPSRFKEIKLLMQIINESVDDKGMTTSDKDVICWIFW